MGVPPPALLCGRAHCRWCCRPRCRLHYARGRFPHAEGGRLGSVLPGAGGAAVLGRLLVPGYRPPPVCAAGSRAGAVPGPLGGRLGRAAAPDRARPARRRSGADGRRRHEAGAGDQEAPRPDRRDRADRPGAGPGAGRHGPPRRQGGHHRAARPSPRHPPPSSRPGPWRRADHPRRAQRRARRAGHRPARAPVGRDRDPRLLLRRRTAHQRDQAQRRPACHAGGSPRARAAAGAGQRRRLRRRPYRGPRWPGRARRAGQDRGRQAAGRQPARGAHRGHRRAAVPRLTGPEPVMRIVIAEDSAVMRAGLAEILADSDHEVVAAVGNAEDLLAAVDEHRPDTAVVDVRMPPGYTDEGLRAAIAIRRDHPTTGVLVFSQYIETRYTADLLGAASGGGAAGVGYLLKDRVADVEEFVEALSRVAAGGTALDPEVVTQLLRASRRTDGLGALTAREHDVLALMAEGRSNGAIADTLVISERAVEKHVANIFSKLGLAPSDADHRRVLAVLRYLES